MSAIRHSRHGLRVSLRFLSALLLVLGIGVTATAQETLRIVSPHPAAIRDEFTNGFKQWMNRKYKQQVDIEWLDQGGTSNIMRFVLSEFKRSPQGINIDLFFGGGTDSYIQLTREELLEPYVVPAAILDQVGQSISGVPVYDPAYRWYGVALAGFGIMYNRLLQTRFRLPAVETWEDLADPKLLGRIATADPRNSGSAHMVYEIILQAYGWEKGWRILIEMSGNVKMFTTGASDVPNEVALGNVIYGPVIDFYAYAQIARTGRDRIAYITPEGLSVINPDAIGILKGAPHRELAQRFVEYCLSEDAQKLLMLPKGDPEGPKTAEIARASVLPALYGQLGDRSIIPQNPFEIRNTIEYDAALGSRRWSLVNDLFGAFIIDTHRELVAAWKVVAKRGDETSLATFGTMPVSEEEAAELATQWDTPDFALARKQRISEWREAARAKYDRARKGQ